MDEFAIKKGHRDYATVIVDLERVEIIDILEYRDQKKLVLRGFLWSRPQGCTI